MAARTFREKKTTTTDKSRESLFRLNFNVYINVGNKERARARNRKRMVTGSELKSYAEETREKKNEGIVGARAPFFLSSLSHFCLSRQFFDRALLSEHLEQASHITVLK